METFIKYASSVSSLNPCIEGLLLVLWFPTPPLGEHLPLCQNPWPWVSVWWGGKAREPWGEQVLSAKVNKGWGLWHHGHRLLVETDICIMIIQLSSILWSAAGPCGDASCISALLAVLWSSLCPPSDWSEVGQMSHQLLSGFSWCSFSLLVPSEVFRRPLRTAGSPLSLPLRNVFRE